MKEQLVNFETAKLAKEKGFNHIKANCYGDNMCYQLPEGNLINAVKGNVKLGYILAPTQSLLQKWLREVHNIHIYVEPYWKEEDAKNINVKPEYCAWYIHGQIDIDEVPEFDKTYEEALEKGLQDALKLI